MRSASALYHLPRQSRTLTAFAMALSPFAKASDAVAPRTFKLNSTLVRDFIVWSGGCTEAWGPHVPPTFFPYWTMPSLVACIRGRQLKLAKLLNGGCTIRQLAPIPIVGDLVLDSWFKGIESRARHDLISLGSRTRDKNGLTLLETEVRFILPKSNPKAASSKSTPMIKPPEETRLANLSARKNDGFTFACLTGDFNPIHWIPSVAKLSGFPSCIQHGFGTLAKSYEHLLQAQKVTRSSCDLTVDFKRTVPLPSTASLFADDDQISVWVDGMQRPSLQGQLNS